MRTTLDIADDVLQAAKELARRRGITAGQVLSDLARTGLQHPEGGTAGPRQARRRKAFLGFDPFPSRGGVVTDELINRLREDEPE